MSPVRPSPAYFTGPGGNSYEILVEMLSVAGRGAELKAAADRVRKMAEALYAAAEYAANVAFTKHVTLGACRDAGSVVGEALLANNMSCDAVHKALDAFYQELIEIQVARESGEKMENRDDSPR